MPSARLILDQQPNQLPDEFPSILNTPSGLALIEIQGRINIGNQPLIGSALDLNHETDASIQPPTDASIPRILGHLEFSNGNQVTLNVGNRQRLRGKIVELKPPLAILQMHKADVTRTQLSQNNQQESVEIPVMEIIKQKIIFNTRPEPVLMS